MIQPRSGEMQLGGGVSPRRMRVSPEPQSGDTYPSVYSGHRCIPDLSSIATYSLSKLHLA